MLLHGLSMRGNALMVSVKFLIMNRFGMLAPKIKPGHEEEIASDPHIWGDLPERFENFVPGLVAAIQRMEQKWQA